MLERGLGFRLRARAKEKMSDEYVTLVHFLFSTSLDLVFVSRLVLSFGVKVRVPVFYPEWGAGLCRA